VEGYEPETWINTIEDVLKTHPEPKVEELREYDWNDIIRKFTNKYNM
jgi:hypothetical protein